MSIIGRHTGECLSCGYNAMHVKRNEGKRAYVHCPECGFNAPTRNGQQESGLLARMRPDRLALVEEVKPAQAIAATHAPAPEPAQAAPAPAAPPKPKPKPASPWATLLDTLSPKPTT